jgi:hypothetical protein
MVRSLVRRAAPWIVGLPERGRIGQTAKTVLGKPCPPFRDRIRPHAKPFGDRHLWLAAEAGKNDPGPLDQLLLFRPPPADPLQLGTDLQTT